MQLLGFQAQSTRDIDAGADTRDLVCPTCKLVTPLSTLLASPSKSQTELLTCAFSRFKQSMRGSKPTIAELRALVARFSGVGCKLNLEYEPVGLARWRHAVAELEARLQGDGNEGEGRGSSYLSLRLNYPLQSIVASRKAAAQKSQAAHVHQATLKFKKKSEKFALQFKPPSSLPAGLAVAITLSGSLPLENLPTSCSSSSSSGHRPVQLSVINQSTPDSGSLALLKSLMLES